MAGAEPETYEVLLDEDTPSLLEIPDDQIVTPKIDRERARELTSGLKEAFTPLIPMVEATFSDAKRAEISLCFGRLDRRAKVYFAAERRAERPLTADDTSLIKELTKKNREKDKLLMKWAWPFFSDQPQLRDELEQIRAKSGFRDDAEDVLSLVTIFRERWIPDDLARACPITLEQLTEAELDATRYLDLTKATKNDKKGSPAVLRHRAYTAWKLDYDLLTSVGRFLTPQDKNPPKRFPGAYMPSSKSTKPTESSSDLETPL